MPPSTTARSIIALKQTQAKSLQLRCISSIRGVLTVRNDHHCLCADVVTMKIREFWYTLMLGEKYEYFSELFLHLY